MRFPIMLLAICAAVLLAGCAGTPNAGQALRTAERSALESDDGPTGAELQREFEEATRLLRQGEYQQGLALLDRLLRSREARKSTAFHINRGLAYEKLGRLEQAEEAFKAALALEPGHPVANNEYGMILRRAGRFAEARAAYEMALSGSPGFLAARRNLGILCDLYLGDLECAMSQYQAYAAAVPDDKAVATWIADLQQKMKK